MVTYDDFIKLDLRVATVLDVEDHPDADRLYVLRIEVGEEKKQIVAGVKASYAPEELMGKKIVIVNNLEPAVIRGQESSGMLLAASSDGTPVVITPEKDIPSGARIK
ncbi:MAG: methionine--tRNA ligase subunit beta [Candidatus Omnitrophica bacterium]|nr:methionine--tRNA ligase subunit beta [Candidatus Omnitrophota bacterium]